MIAFQAARGEWNSPAFRTDRLFRGTPARFTRQRVPAAIRPATGCAPLTRVATARERGAREKREAGGGTPAPRVIACDGPDPLQTVRDRRAPHGDEAAPPTTPHLSHEVSPWKV
jgi:hypothetical protein